MALDLLPTRAVAYKFYEESEAAARMEPTSWFASGEYADDIYYSGLPVVNLLGNSTSEGEFGV